jgi:hypothetical protein
MGTGLLALLIILFIKSGRTGRIILGTIIAVPACLLITFIVLRFSVAYIKPPTERVETTIQYAKPDIYLQQENNVVSGGVSMVTQFDPVRESFEIHSQARELLKGPALADIYPSGQSAAMALTQYLIHRWEKVIPGNKEPTSVTLVGDVEHDILTKVAETIREHNLYIPLKISKATTTRPSASAEDRAIVLQISIPTVTLSAADIANKLDVSKPVSSYAAISAKKIEVSKANKNVEISASNGLVKIKVDKPGKSVDVSIGKSLIPKVNVQDNKKREIIKVKKGENSGTVEVALIGKTGERRKSVRYIYKPWVDNLAEFINRDPHKQWVVARSTQLMPTQHEAERSAIRSAAEQLLPRLKSHRPALAQRSIEMNAVEDRLRSNDIISDRFVQHYKRPYGDVWSESILIDASNIKLQAVASHLLRTHHSGRVMVLKKFASIGGLALLIILVYLFLNAATKGYYKWALRIVGIAGAGALLLLLLNYA